MIRVRFDVYAPASAVADLLALCSRANFPSLGTVVFYVDNGAAHQFETCVAERGHAYRRSLKGD